jgi:hypothetical protein
MGLTVWVGAGGGVKHGDGKKPRTRLVCGTKKTLDETPNYKTFRQVIQRRKNVLLARSAI